MQLFKCGQSDCKTLATLNKHLIEDEHHDNSMNIAELEVRMNDFLSSGYEAFFLIDNEKVIGYALINKSSNPYYLRQFFICRDMRRKGCGQIFFYMLLEYLDVSVIDIEVLSWNETGRAFWESLGFKPRSVYMRYDDERRL